VQGVLIEVLKDSTVIANTTTGPAQTNGSYQYNYKIEVPIGTYTVRATKSGYKSTPVTGVTVNLGQETKNVNFPLEPLVTFPQGLALVSAPYDYTGRGAGSLFSIPFKMATWPVDSYIFYPDVPADTFRLGMGYFLMAGDKDKRLSLTVQGTPTDESKPYELDIHMGWNLIGHPFTFPVDWTGVRVRDETGTYSLQEAATRNILSQVLWRFIPVVNQYEITFRLTPWQGYWVRAFKNATLIIPNTPSASRSEESALTRSLAAGSGWRMQLVATNGDLKDTSNYLGASSNASDGFDPVNDAEKPPMLPGIPYLYISFPHKDWKGAAGSYAIDVRSASTKEQVWEFVVETNVPGRQITLTWPDIQRVPKDVQLTLVDLDTSRRQFMRTTGGYTFRMSEGATTRKLRIESSAARAGALLITNAVAAPLRQGRGSTISFTLSQEATVEVSIYTLTGKPIRTVARSAGRSGSNQVVWDGKDRQGRSVPSGSYLFVIRATGTTGETVKATNILPVSR